MSQRVPNWDADDDPIAPRISLSSYSNSIASDVPRLDYEVAELTWENGQISMHGFGLPRVPAKPAIAAAATNSSSAAAPSDKHTWEKPLGGTLESIVNQATRFPHRSKTTIDAVDDGSSNGRELVPWFDSHPVAGAAAAMSNAMTMDGLVPCSNRTDEQSAQMMDSIPGPGTCVVRCSRRVASCSGASTQENDAVLAAKSARAARVPVVEPEWSGRDKSVSSGANFRGDSQHVTLDTWDKELGMGFTSISMGSPENTSSAMQCAKTTTADDHDSVGHSGPLREAGDDEEDKKGTGKSSVSTKRSRAAAIHNQSERKRRDKINQRMKTLQKLVPNSSKTDKASMLDEVIDYLKQLQAQVQMMNRMNMSPMMLPLALQQQLQMSMLAPMGMGLGMGMGIGMCMDMNSVSRPAANIPGMPAVIPPAAFMPLTAWDASGGDRMQGPPATVVPDPLSAFLACQQQPMSIDAYSRMAAIYQQLQQQFQQNPASNSTNRAS